MIFIVNRVGTFGANFNFLFFWLHNLFYFCYFSFFGKDFSTLD